MDNQSNGAILDQFASKYNGGAQTPTPTADPSSNGAILSAFAAKHGRGGDPSAATNAAIRAGANPKILQNAYKSLGRQDYIGLCEKFVENVGGKDGVYPSAADAWNARLGKARGGLQFIQPGDEVYFAPDSSNGYNGHTGIYVGNNKMISATYNGVEQSDLNDWQKQTGQQVLGYIPGED